MISSYETNDFYPSLDSLNKLGAVLDINILCKDGYSKFLLESNKFKNKLLAWRKRNNLTKRDAARVLEISERGYASWENGILMSITTYNKVKHNLLSYNLL